MRHGTRHRDYDEPMSFGLSRGKTLVTEGFGLDAQDLPSFNLDDPASSRVDPREWFEHPERPFEIEIGSGKGAFLVQQAKHAPEVNYLGIEQAGEFYRYAADRMRRHDLRNVRLLHADAVEFIRFRCPDAIAGVIHLYFSDPWPKKRHHKRRVVQDASLREFDRVLAPGGEIRIVTDHVELWAWYEMHATNHEDQFLRDEFTPPAWTGERELIGTNYERKFGALGKPIHAMVLKKLSST